MTLANLMDKVIGRQRQRQECRHEAYRALVAQVADGHEPDADHVGSLLGALGKSHDNLAADVQRLEQRRQWRAQLDALPQLADEHKCLGNQIAAADRELKNAERKHMETTVPLYARLDEIKQAQSAAEDARRRLQNTCTDPTVLAELNEVTTALAETSRQRSKLADVARQLRELANSDRSEVRHARSEGQIEKLRARATRRDTQAASVEVEFAKLATEESTLHGRESAIRQRMIEA